MRLLGAAVIGAEARPAETAQMRDRLCAPTTATPQATVRSDPAAVPIRAPLRARAALAAGRIAAGRITAGLIAAGLITAGLIAVGCGSEPEAERIPTTLPVLTTLRPQLTTTTIAPPPPQRRIYVVQPGDTLNKIANGFDVSVEALMEENGKQDTLLRIGEQLVIPPTVIGAGSDQ